MSANHIDWKILRGQALDPVRGQAGHLLRQTRLLQRDLDEMRLQATIRDQIESDPPPEDDSTSRDSSEQSSDSAASSEDEKKKKRAKKTKASKTKGKGAKSNNGSAGIEQLLNLLAGKVKQNPTPPTGDSILESLPPSASAPPPPALNASDIAAQVVALLKQEENPPDGKKAPGKVGSKVAFKRVDHVYDRKTHNYKLKETIQSDPKTDHWDQVSPGHVGCSVLTGTVCLQRSTCV